MVVGIESGAIVDVVLITGVEEDDKRTMQLRVIDASFPELSRAVIRIMRVPETSCGILKV
jgi:hypothetical protein